MKKLISIILVLILSLSCFALASCDKEEMTPEQLEAFNAYNAALKKTNALDCLNGKLNMDISMSANLATEKVTYQFDMKMMGGPDPKTAKMRIDGNMNIAGQKMVMDCYLENGWAYYDMTTGGQKLKFKVNLAGGENEYAEMFNMGNVELPKSMFKKVSITNNADGSKTFSITLSGKELLSSYSNFAGAAGAEVSPSNISDASVTAIVDANGYLAKTVIKYSMDIQGVHADAVLEVEYLNPGQTVTVEPIEGYQSFPEQKLPS